MLTELHGKGGRVCQPAREGKLHCPLIIRPTSEDVITGNIALVLKAINPRWWLPQLLNQALGAPRFRQQMFRRLRIELWQNQPPFPRELLPWDEGSTQVDMVITWENPPTTVYLEFKYQSDLSPSTAGGKAHSEFPSDQLIRNIRVGLWRCGWFDPPGLFVMPPRDFVMIVVGPGGAHPLVERYRDYKTLQQAIPKAEQILTWPRMPFVGWTNYAGVTAVLRRHQGRMNLAERVGVETLANYLGLKRQPS